MGSKAHCSCPGLFASRIPVNHSLDLPTKRFVVSADALQALQDMDLTYRTKVGPIIHSAFRLLCPSLMGPL